MDPGGVAIHGFEHNTLEHLLSRGPPSVSQIRSSGLDRSGPAKYRALCRSMAWDDLGLWSLFGIGRSPVESLRRSHGCLSRDNLLLVRNIAPNDALWVDQIGTAQSCIVHAQSAAIFEPYDEFEWSEPTVELWI